MSTLLFVLGGENFYDTDFDPYNYSANWSRLWLAFKRETKNIFSGTSSTSLTIGTGSKSLTVLNADGVPPAGFTGLPRVYIRDSAAPATNYMVGAPTAYDSTTGAMTVSVDTIAGSGTKTSWIVTIAGENGAATGATNTPQYLTLAADAGLVNERVWTPGAGVRATDGGAGAAYTVDLKNEVEAVSGTTYSMVAGDCAKLKRFTNASGCAVTALRANVSANAPLGFFLQAEAAGGAVTLTPSTGTINGAASFLLPAGSAALLVSDGADDWKAIVIRRAVQSVPQTGATLTADRSHNRALLTLDRSAGVTVTLPATDGLGIGPDFELEFQAVTGAHLINCAGSNVVDKAGGPTSISLAEGQGIKLRSNGGSGASGIWSTQRGMADLGVSSVRNALCLNNAGTPNTQLDMDADVLVLRNAANGTTVRYDPGAALTCNLATAGPAANGRDQASAFANSSQVHLYWIFGTSGLATIASNTAPPTGPILPTGYSYWAYACSLVLDSSGNLPRFRLRGRKLTYDARQQALSSTTVTTTEQNLDLSAYVPAVALETQIAVDVDTFSNGGNIDSELLIRMVSGSDFDSVPIKAPQANTFLRPAKTMLIPNVGRALIWKYLNTTVIGGTTLKVNVQGYTVPNGDS